MKITSLAWDKCWRSTITALVKTNINSPVETIDYCGVRKKAAVYIDDLYQDEFGTAERWKFYNPRLKNVMVGPKCKLY